MYFAHIALGAVCYVLLVKAVEENEENSVSEEYLAKNDETLNLIDNHTFVALVDIVFTDDAKRTCTGSIIHDNVVITAAHCFKSPIRQSKAKPELTASFVVIGTKDMFDSGYEQYLPIERVLTHPKYKAWTADLSLVFTFAGMTSDKPGTIIPLAGEKTATNMDSNVTVLSWGPVITLRITKPPVTTKRTSAESEESCDSDIASKEKGKNRKPYRFDVKGRTKPTLTRNHAYVSYERSHSLSSEEIKGNKNNNPQQISNTYGFRQHSEPTFADSFSRKEKRKKHTSKIMSQYLSAVERLSVDNIELKFDGPRTFDSTSDTTKIKSAVEYEKWTMPNETKYVQPMTTTNANFSLPLNKMTVESFGFVNFQACKTLVEKTMPPQYDLGKSNDAVCYSSSDLAIKDEDSGAPAIRNGQLVAVTIGGVRCSNDRAAVGMKISCYCSWIADNLPKGDEPINYNCCKNCCDVRHKEELIEKQFLKNKYLV